MTLNEDALDKAKDAAHAARSKLPYDIDTRYADGVAGEAAIETYLIETRAAEASQQPLILREIRTDLKRLHCPSCLAHNVFLTHTVMNSDARRHVECRICQMRGPVKTSAIEAVNAWNGLPR